MSHWNFAKTCEDPLWNHCTSTSHRSETNGIAERAVRRVKMEHPRYFFKPVWMKNGGLIPWNVTVTCKAFKTSSRKAKILTNGVMENHVSGPKSSFLWIDD